MEDKKINNLLRIIVEEYIKTASPVGSTLVAKKYFKDVSSATIRNYMAELEERDLVFQPHTSSGRVPTTLGYRRYVDKFVLDKEKVVIKELDEKFDDAKSWAKKVAEVAGQAVLLGFSPHDVYYTGISNLFGQSEFSSQNVVYNMSAIIDHLDETMSQIFDFVESGQTRILIGDENPFGEVSSVILGKYTIDDQENIFGILGPVRMDYLKNKNLVDISKEKLSKINK